MKHPEFDQNRSFDLIINLSQFRGKYCKLGKDDVYYESCTVEYEKTKRRVLVAHAHVLSLRTKQTQML